MIQTNRIVVKGLVQGIGYRPFVAELARQLNISGTVRNNSGIVTIIARGKAPAMNEFIDGLTSKAPAYAQVTEISVEVISTNDDEAELANESSGFCIVESTNSDNETFPCVPVDLPTCKKCESELFDPDNRRFRHPFISCTSCGPRYSIIKQLPYDRCNITMNVWDMCSECRQEYVEVGNRRRHAQTIACNTCGPVLEFIDVSSSRAADSESANNITTDNRAADNRTADNRAADNRAADNRAADNRAADNRTADNITTDNRAADNRTADNRIIGNRDAYEKALMSLRAGCIVAIKDIGGFHLACNPYDSVAVAKLRKIKARDKKPLAVMFGNAAQVRMYCEVSLLEEQLLESSARPIVLLRKKKEQERPLACGVCDDSDDIGAMLPCNPVQLMLMKDYGPLIMTSANLTGEPMFTDGDALTRWLDGRACVLTHNREILTPLDDSVVRVVNNRLTYIRRARGYVPEAIMIDMSHIRTGTINSNTSTINAMGVDVSNIREDFNDIDTINVMDTSTGQAHTILAMGADLKSTCALMKDGQVVLSCNNGDLENVACIESYKREIYRMQKIFQVAPDIVVTDMHPGYNSVKVAYELISKGLYKDRRLIKVQHHRAHVASVMAEHNLRDNVIGFAFDGTGYGDDGTVWGSEVFYGSITGLRRIAHMKTIYMTGSDESSKNTMNSLHSYLAGNVAARREIEQHKELFPYVSLTDVDTVGKALNMNINCIGSSSMGRLFDAVSALLGICSYNTYEAEAAVALENEARRYVDSITYDTKHYGDSIYDIDSNDQLYDISDCRMHRFCVDNIGIDGNEICVKQRIHINILEDVDESENVLLIGDTDKLILDLVKLICEGNDKAYIAYSFIDAVAKWILDVATRTRKMNLSTYNSNIVVLSGGTFQNKILLESVIRYLSNEGFKVYINEKVPANDGGISLGQAYIASELVMSK